MKRVIIAEKSYAFGVRIVNLYNYLTRVKREFHMSRQIQKSGTSIGANVAEAQRAQSTADFVAKMNIAMKEANETQYWLHLLRDTNYLTAREHESMNADLTELLKILTAICKHYPQNNRQ